MKIRLELTEDQMTRLYHLSSDSATPEEHNIALFMLHSILEDKLDRMAARELYAEEKNRSSKR